MGPMQLFVLTILFLWFLPAAIAFFSDREQGSRKALWVLGMVFTSWLGFLVFLLATTRRDDRLGANSD